MVRLITVSSAKEREKKCDSSAIVLSSVTAVGIEVVGNSGAYVSAIVVAIKSVKNMEKKLMTEKK